MPELLVEAGGPVTTLRLCRPDRLNAVTEELYERLIAALGQASGDRDVRAVVLTGEGRAFCVGADLKGHGEQERSGAERRHYVELGQRAAQAIFDCDVPVVAAVNGHAIGAGLELALACDLSVVASSAKLRLPELALGTFVGGGTTFTLVERVGMTKAKELLLLGRFFSGAEAVAMGLCNDHAEAASVLPRAREMAAAAAQMAPRSVAFAKRLLRQAGRQSVAAAMAAEAEALVGCMGTRDWQEGIDAFAQRREARFTGD
ncbi:MAG: enoyl-CoA hydratase/isomerase family protein [Planctomycetota bacterium]